MAGPFLGLLGTKSIRIGLQTESYRSEICHKKVFDWGEKSLRVLAGDLYTAKITKQDR